MSAMRFEHWRGLACGCVLTLGGCGERAAEQAVTAALGQAAKFQSVGRHGDMVCGEVNASGAGGTGGYVRFLYGDAARTATIEKSAPYTEAEIGAFDATCQFAAAGGNALDRTVCARAAEARAALEAKARFEREWADACR